jgi:hypothetical protein
VDALAAGHRSIGLLTGPDIDRARDTIVAAARRVARSAPVARAP